MNQNITKQMKPHLRLISSSFINKSISLFLFSSSLLFLVSHTLKLNFDRNYMFLLCNGILVILLKTSSSSSSSSSSSQPHERRVNEFSLASERKHVSESVHVEQSNPDEKTGFLTVGGSSSEELQVSEVFTDCDRLQNDNVDEEAEELNKRCEEFIRRMKQGIISESRGEATQM